MSIAKDPINPEHYKHQSKETIEILKDTLSPEEFRGFLKGNVIKYLTRYEHKNGLEDLKKAEWYLRRLTDEVNSYTANEQPTLL